MDKFGTLLENMNPKKVGYTILGLLVGSLLIFTIIKGNSGSSVDSYPIEGSDQDYSTRVRLINSELLFKQLSGDRRYDSVSEDLYIFATSAYSKYKTDKPEVIGFVISGKSEKKDETVTFEGSYGAEKNKIKVTATILKNDRVKTSITDTKTKLNIDSKLPSNSKLNQYISELPKSGVSYEADYVRSSENISIFLNERTPSLLDTALGDLQSYMDDGSYDRSRVEVIFPTESVGL